MKKVLGYIRVSTDSQDLEKQKHLLLEHAQKNELLINEFIESEVSSRETKSKRKIDQLLEKLKKGDTLLVAELSRLGRNMLETLNIINELSEKGIKIEFIRQPELSTTGSHANLLLAIYSYFAQAEREYISIRTKQGLAAAKAKGKQLGRPKGSKNKKGSVLDSVKDEIKELLKLRLSLTSILKIINSKLEKPVTYNALKYYIKHQKDLKEILDLKKSVRISLWLRVENNNKYVKGKKKVQQNIENYILSRYNMRKPRKNSNDYELIIPYENDKDLDDEIYDLLTDMGQRGRHEKLFY